ncbi:hypothetical protein ACFQY4_30430 [Catellatospora bangladeshensis]|uniref:Uncharacterized protein n=1 Tax=Catellatospora bangladeshensis TaxID=310355 RepID=A0A8J3JJV7_9ACTN|nr:hypothetical protein [Catellatospora bangladeshensis]GIF86226.1 hypothetical protein Cba03nite_75750 [Catellatospora bangladeshensis]
MADHTARRPSAPVGLAANLTIGMSVHLLAAVVYAVLSLLRLEGCDRSDGLAAGWTLAVLIDLMLGGILLAMALRRVAGGSRWAVLAGWAVSFVPFVVAAAVSMRYLNSLPSGCE